MLKDVLAHLDFSAWAEISFCIFALTFVAVTIATLRSDKRLAQKHAFIALDDTLERNDDE
jgi:hypothetical protein